MSKKSLLDGLESLFEPDDNNFQASNPLLATTAVPKTNATATKKAAKTKKGKSFTDNLDAFFEGSTAVEVKKRKPSKRNPLLGIDALIRRTFDEDKHTEDRANRIKRLTLSLNIDMISELKRIARAQNKLVSQLVAELVELYFKDK